MTTINVYDKDQVDAKAAAVLPDTSGASEGQVLGLDANLEPAWIDVSADPVEINVINARPSVTPAKTMTGYKIITYNYYSPGNYSSNQKVYAGGKIWIIRRGALSTTYYSTPHTFYYSEVSDISNDALISYLNTYFNQLDDGTYDMTFGAGSQIITSPSTQFDNINNNSNTPFTIRFTKSGNSFTIVNKTGGLLVGSSSSTLWLFVTSLYQSA